MISLYSILLVSVTLATILSRRTMYAILHLILLFTLIAIFVLSLGVDFIGLIFIIVYVGAIATLFLFIIMMLGGESWTSDPALDLEIYNLLLGSGFRSSRLVNLLYKAVWYLKHIALDISIMFVIGLVFFETIITNISNNFIAWLDVIQISYLSIMYDTSYLYGIFFYNYWYIPLLLAAVVLLIAMLGSIILTTRLILVDGKPVITKPKIGEIDKVSHEHSPIIAKLLEQQKREEIWATRTLPLQLLWSGISFAIALWFKDPFMISQTIRWIYISVWICIYLAGSFYITRWGTKRK